MQHFKNLPKLLQLGNNTTTCFKRGAQEYYFKPLSRKIFLQDVRCIYDRAINPTMMCGSPLPERYANDTDILNNNIREKYILRSGGTKPVKGINMSVTNCLHQLRNIYYFLVKKGSNFPKEFCDLTNETEIITNLKSQELLATSYYFLRRRSGDKFEIENQQPNTESQKIAGKFANPENSKSIATQSIIVENRWLSTSEWDDLFHTLERESHAYTRVFLMNTMLEFISMCNCAYRDSLDIKKHLNGEVMRSLVEYVTLDKNIKLTQRGMGQYIYELCKYEMYDIGYDIYDKIYSKKFNFFGPNLQYALIKLLSNTKHWEKAIPFLQYHQITKQFLFPDSTYNFILKAAMRFGTYEDVEELYNYAIQNKFLGKFNQTIFTDIVKYFGYSENKETWERNKGHVFHLLQHMEENNIYLKNAEIAVEFANWLKLTENKKWIGKKLKTENLVRGMKCPVTGNPIGSELVTDDQCYKLGSELYHNVVRATVELQQKPDFETKGTEKMLYNTHPQELKSFVKFLLSTGPYNLVVDGMNLFYAVKFYNRIKEKQISMDQRLFLYNRMSHVIDSAKLLLFEKQKTINIKTLIIFKRHMHKSFLSSAISERTDLTNCYFIDNKSADDYYVTFAGLMSGKSTFVLSNDLYKNSKVIMSNPELFHKWQRQTQCNYISKGRNNPIQIQAPRPFNVSIQQINGNWYLPYYQSDEEDSRYLPTTWLLLYSNSK